MHARKPFQILGIILVLGFLMALTGCAYPARPSMSPQKDYPTLAAPLSGIASRTPLTGSTQTIGTHPAQPAGSAQAVTPYPTPPTTVTQAGSVAMAESIGPVQVPSGSASGNAIAVDADGNVYITGDSEGTWGNPIRAYTAGAGADAFVAKLDSNGTLLWNTFLGSNAGENSFALAVDAAGNVYVAGWSSASWGTPINPHTEGCDEPMNCIDAFVAKLDNSGALVWNTFLGGGSYDNAVGIVVDENGNVLVTGCSDAGWGNPVLPFVGIREARDAFVAALDANGSLIWNTFLGSSREQVSGFDIAVDASGNAYLVGQSFGTWGSPVNAFPTRGVAAFVAKLDNSGALTWNTFLGGGVNSGEGIGLDKAGNIYVAGDSSNTWGSPVAAFNDDCGALSCHDVYVAKLDGSGILIWNTFVGGGSSQGWDIALDAEGSAYIAGSTFATWGEPVRPFSSWSKPVPPASGGDLSDAFIAKVDSTGMLAWNTFLGSEFGDIAWGITTDGLGNVYPVGSSGSTWGDPLLPYSGESYPHAFAAKLLGNTGELVWNTFLGGPGGLP